MSGFTYDIEDYSETIRLLERIRNNMESNIQLFTTAGAIPETHAPVWRGDTATRLKAVMDEYAAKARALRMETESLLEAALKFCRDRQRDDEDFNSSLRGIE